jgi:hypothetical protein
VVFGNCVGYVVAVCFASCSRCSVILSCICCSIPYVFMFEINSVHVVCFLLGNSPASEVYMPTFRNISIFTGR